MRSDQYSFVKKGIPAVFVFPGMKSSKPGVDGKARFTEYLTTRDHTPSDDMSQTFDFDAGALGARFNFLIGYEAHGEILQPVAPAVFPSPSVFVVIVLPIPLLDER